MSGVVVFAYNFPHRKTQDVLLALAAAGREVSVVIAADAVELGIASSTIRTKVQGTWAAHPRVIARSLGFPYKVAPHSGAEIDSVIDAMEPDLGIIAGARILQPSVLDGFSVGVVNTHPGLIPEVRGLDSMLWAIRDDHALGVTAHLIDRRVDAGRILVRREIPVSQDDTIFDLSERLYGAQLEMLPEALDAADRGQWKDVPPDLPAPRGKMSASEEHETLALVPDYVLRRAR